MIVYINDSPELWHIFKYRRDRNVRKKVVLEYYDTISACTQRCPVQNRFVMSYLDCATLSFKQSYPFLE